jgi:hypothetical protein
MTDLVHLTPSFVSGFALAVSASTFVWVFFLRHLHRCSLRRELIHVESAWALADALARFDHRAAVHAEYRRQERLWVETKAQSAHPWHWWRFWKLAPPPGEPWPDADEHEPRQTALFN